jgi:transposase-like protein
MKTTGRGSVTLTGWRDSGRKPHAPTLLRPPPLPTGHVWLKFRFALNYRDVEDMLAERGIDASYETVRRWALKFGRSYADRIRRRRPRTGPPNGGRPLVQSKRDRKAALKLLRRQGYIPDAIVTDRLRSYGAALRDLGLADRHVTGWRSNNRAEASHQLTRHRRR